MPNERTLSRTPAAVAGERDGPSSQPPLSAASAWASTAEAPTLADRINDALPQTQCTRCGYPDCAAYASAMAQGEAAINLCPPGGAEGIARLAALTGQDILPLDPEHGTEGPRHLAVIDEDWCIGCTLCFKACPTDAIVGANKTMHVVLDEHCTGCELCIPVCPVDCISLENVSGSAHGWAAWSAAQAHTARHRYTHRAQRLGLQIGQALPPLQQRRGIATPVPAGASTQASPSAHAPATDSKAAMLAAIMAKARNRRGLADLP